MKIKGLVITAIVLILIGISGYIVLTKEDKVTSLNLFEKQWIESNKNKLIDMSIVNDIPILSYNGEGLILDFLNALNSDTNLAFNKISYKIGDEVKSDYAFKLVDTVGENDILVYTDNYVILTKNKTYLSLDELKGLTIGVLSEDLDIVNNYLYKADVTYKTYDDRKAMLEAFAAQDTKLNGIVVLKTINLKTIIENNYKIAYHINDYQKHIVLTLGNEEKLNSILTKYYNRWSNKNYDKSYNKYLSKNYFGFNGINESDTVKFRSKRYNYGFISNAPYDYLLDGKLKGINSDLLSNFSRLTNAEISYKEYHNIDDLIEAFNANKLDIFYGINTAYEYSMDVYETTRLYNNNVFILKHSTNNKIIDSIKSLNDVAVVEKSSLAAIFESNNISVKTYATIDEMLKKIDKNSIIAIDGLSYNYYKNYLQNFIISYQFNVDDYSFVIRDIEDNKLFRDMFDFYISFIDTDKYVNSGLSSLVIIKQTPVVLKNLAITLGVIVGLLLVFLGVIKVKPKKTNLSKEDKLRYIDALTSLKNRNYLNDSIEKWDKNETYPQAVVIVDLNNIAYINDNYGHSEGDIVINQAANVLIVNQVEHSEIIRTNGNEFLVYMVGYDEKQVITYIRKLYKDLKEIKHGFGAAIGYSIINDDIKTVDDAINEATIDMRNNKEIRE